MNKAQLIDKYRCTLSCLMEEPHGLVLSGGSALVLMGIRTSTSMMSGAVIPSVFKWLSNKHTVLKRKHIGTFIQLDYKARIHEGSEDTGVVCIDGIWCCSPFELLKQKRHMANLANRNPKRLARDREEIKVLEGIVKSNRLTARAITPA